MSVTNQQTNKQSDFIIQSNSQIYNSKVNIQHNNQSAEEKKLILL